MLLWLLLDAYTGGIVTLGNAYVSVLDEGDLDVRAVAQKSAIISLRHSLETLGKWKISYAVSISLHVSITYCHDRQA